MNQPESELDRKIREKLQKRDTDFSEELKQEMKSEEDQLRKYFKQFKKPVDKDPTVISIYS